MTKKGMLEYLSLFNDDAELRIIIGNRSMRQICPPIEEFYLTDTENPTIFLGVGDGENMDESEKVR